MKIQKSYVMEQDYIAAFDDLLKKTMTAKQCMEMITSAEIITAEHNRLIKAQLVLLQQYCQTSKDGVLLFDKDTGEVLYKDADSKKTFEKEITELKSGDIEIPLSSKIKIYEDDILTPRKVFLLRDMIEIVERPKESHK